MGEVSPFELIGLYFYTTYKYCYRCLAEDTQSEESVDLSEQDHCHSERSSDLEAEVPESFSMELVAFDRDFLVDEVDLPYPAYG